MDTGGALILIIVGLAFWYSDLKPWLNERFPPRKP